jgi:hypothetical protein
MEIASDPSELKRVITLVRSIGHDAVLCRHDLLQFIIGRCMAIRRKKYQEGEVVAMMNHYYRRVIGVTDHSSDCNDKVTKALQ